MSLAYFGRPEADRQNLIILACSGISFNNHWYPRGHLLHSLVNDQIVENQLNFVGRAADAEPVISAEPYDEGLKKSMTKLLLHYRSEKLIKKRELNMLNQLLDEVFFTPDVLSQKRFIDQITITNFHIWKRMFASYSGNVPNLVFLSQEDVAAQLLKEFHLDQDTMLHHLLFDQKWHELIYKYFNNIMCAFSIERNYGTFLFWATPKNTKKRLQLFAKNGRLESPDGTFTLTLTPEAIGNALRNDEIAPSTMLTFIVLSLYYGFALTGGLDQPTYLEQTKQAYIAMLEELGLRDEVENCKPIVANDIIYTRPTLAFIDGPLSQRVPASALDMIVHGNQNSWSTVIEAAKQVTMHELLYRLYPELYRDYCKHTDKDDKLLQITERDIEQYTGIDRKIPPWAIFNSLS
jgi:hypothetical protein